MKPRLVNLRFGDVIRVDETQITTKQPDIRRWVILGKMADGRWLTVYIEPGLMLSRPESSMLIHWPPDLSGFRFADEDESVVPYWGL